MPLVVRLARQRYRIENSTKFFLDLGFDVTGSPWYDHRNVQQWAETLNKHREGTTHVLGEIYTSCPTPQRTRAGPADRGAVLVGSEGNAIGEVLETGQGAK